MHIKPFFIKWVLGVSLVACLFLPGIQTAGAFSGSSPNPDSKISEYAQEAMLSEADLPGFGTADETNEVGWLALARRMTAGLTGSQVKFANDSVFSTRDLFQPETVINFLAYPLSETDAVRFDALIGNPGTLLASLREIVQTSGVDMEPRLLPELGSIGEGSIGFTMTLGMEPVAQAVDFLWARRGEILQSTWVIYPVGASPTLNMLDLGQLVDLRVQERFIGTTFRPAGTYVPDLTTHIPTPLDISTQPAVIGTNLLLAALVMLPFAAAAELFTRLMAEREKRLLKRLKPPSLLSNWIGRAREVLRSGFRGRTPLGNLLRFFMVMFFYGVTFSLLDRTWHPLTLTGIILFLNMTLAYGIVGIADDILQWRALRKWGIPAKLSLRPTNILLAAASTLSSRLIPLVPGLMFGTPEALVVEQERLTSAKRNRLLGISAVTFLTIGFGLWTLTTLTALFQRGGLPETAGNLIGGVEAFLLVIFAVALENTFVQMLGFPGSFGEVLRKRNRWLWLLGLVAIAFVFYHTLINPRGELAEALREANILILLGAAGAFVLLTFILWVYLRITAGQKGKTGETAVQVGSKKTSSRKAAKKAIPAWVWLAVNVLGIMVIGTLLLARQDRLQILPARTSPPGEGEVAPAATATPAAEPPGDLEVEYIPPALLEHLCFLPEMIAVHAAYDTTLWTSLQLVAAQYGAQAVMATSETFNEAFYGEAIDQFIQADCDLIVGTFAQESAIQAAASRNPEQPFIMWDGVVDLPNVWQMESALDQGTYLAGYLAAGISQTSRVGTFGGADYPNIRAYMDCFVQGVSEYDRAHQADVAILGWDILSQQGLLGEDFVSPEYGFLLSDQLISRGADVILPVAGAGLGTTGYGAGQSALEHAGAFVIGVDLDWASAFPEFSEVVLTSVEIRFHQGIALAVDALVNGVFTGGVHEGTLATGEIRLSQLRGFEDLVSPGLAAELEGLAASTPAIGCPVGQSVDPGSILPISTLIPIPTLTPTLTQTPRPTNTPDKGIFNPANGHWYHLFELQISYPRALAFCQERQAHMVTIADVFENQFVYSISPYTMLGASDAAVEGHWEWVTGESWSYTNWAPVEPNDVNGEDLINFKSEVEPGKWNDVSDFSGVFICEWDQ